MKEMTKKPSKRIVPALPKAIAPPPSDGRYERRLSEILSHSPNDAEIQRLYLGRAGELFVAAHLLRRGLNCSPLPVDTGVDLLAHRELNLGIAVFQAEHELYQFQVKTTTTSEYRASLQVRKVHDLWHKAINLVVVFWSVETAPTAIILPPSLIRMLTSGGFEDPMAPLLTTGDEVSLRVIESEGRYFIRNRDHDITAMRNRFDRIEPIGVDTCQFPPYAYWSDGEGLVAFDPD
jgi:hypothetical protein